MFLVDSGPAFSRKRNVPTSTPIWICLCTLLTFFRYALERWGRRQRGDARPVEIGDRTESQHEADNTVADAGGERHGAVNGKIGILFDPKLSKQLDDFPISVAIKARVVFVCTGQSALRAAHGVCCIGASLNQCSDDPLLAPYDSAS
jgi:hypothetical protein